MYKSPIQITQLYEQICNEVVKQQEDFISSAVTRIYVDVDKDELIKALAYDRGQYEKGYSDGRAARDAEIVRCKDCRFSSILIDEKGARFSLCCHHFAYGLIVNDFDFCSQGGRDNDTN